jgi:hypothetical protein
MSDERFDAVCPREGKDGKTYFTNIGKAFPNRTGGYSVRLNALPIPNKEGDVTILLLPEREKDERRAPPARRPAPQKRVPDEDEDEIPF